MMNLTIVSTSYFDCILKWVESVGVVSAHSDHRTHLVRGGMRGLCNPLIVRCNSCLPSPIRNGWGFLFMFAYEVLDILVVGVSTSPIRIVIP